MPFDFNVSNTLRSRENSRGLIFMTRSIAENLNFRILCTKTGFEVWKPILRAAYSLDIWKLWKYHKCIVEKLRWSLQQRCKCLDRGNRLIRATFVILLVSFSRFVSLFCHGFFLHFLSLSSLNFWFFVVVLREKEHLLIKESGAVIQGIQ